MKLDQSKQDAVDKPKNSHPNGALYAEGQFTDNRKVGQWRSYDAKGKLMKTIKHKLT